ncbi:hypothetical protein N2152v2_002461 [Parachlorella kessleri]
MPPLVSFLACDTPSERLACVAAVSLAAGLFLSDAGTSIAALGIVGSLFANRDLVACYMLLTPLSLLSDLIWLITGHPGKLAGFLAFLVLFVKAAGTWFAYDVWRSTDPGPMEAQYQPFGNPPPQPARDPFDRFAAAQQQQQPTMQPQQYVPPQPAMQPAPQLAPVQPSNGVPVQATTHDHNPDLQIV